VSELNRVALASRAFALAAIVGLALTVDDAPDLASILALLGIASLSCYVPNVSAVPAHWVIAVEATVASAVVAAALPQTALLLPYLVVLALLAGLARGASGASLVIVCQLTATLVSIIVVEGAADVQHRVELIAPWTVTITTAGLLGAWAKKLGKSPDDGSTNEVYDSARRLLGQLSNLSRRLSSGLDPQTISTQILDIAESTTHCSQAAVFTRTQGGVFVPLAYRGSRARETFDLNDALLVRAWDSGTPASSELTGSAPPTATVAFPLRLGPEPVGVLACLVSADLPAESIEALDRPLREMSLRLATGLAFDDLRTVVTADERQRLAREIHDGVAQEVASLGYAVDGLAATTLDPAMAEGLKTLRNDLSKLVTELRLSIFDLRTEVADSAGLGSALSDYVRKVGARSTMRVHLSLDEAHTRLSPTVETELFRIAQEAITNARKHSGAQNLWVECWVHPPSAVVRVRDDGTGGCTSRDDSYGLRIMRERAQRIDASLEVEGDRTFGRCGTSVTVSVGEDVPTAADVVKEVS
jgi:signal transduction histidine kinase